MKATKLILGCLATLVVGALAGCGGGGGGSAEAGAPISGVVTKGPVRNGHIQIFEIISSHNPAKARLNPTPFYSGSTGPDGSYQANLPASLSKGGIMIKVIDGTYLDEATGVDKHIENEYPGGMRAVFGNVSGAYHRGSVSMSVTPYTELAAADMKGAYDDDSVKLSHDKIQHAFGFDDQGIDIVTTRPLDASSAFPAGSSAAQQAYSLSMAGFSQYEKDFGAGKNLAAINDDMLANHISSSGVMDHSTGACIATATQTFVDVKGAALNPALNNPAINPNAPARITLAANPSPGVTTGSPVLLSATVLDAAGAPVPDGTSVSFAITSGTGNLANPTKTTGGVATVNLTSSIAGTVLIGANAGSASANVGVPYIVQPTLATLVLAVSGTPPSGALIGGITATIQLPGGVSVKRTSDSALPANQADASVVFGSGLGSTAILLGNVVAGPPQLLQLGLISTGTAAGEFGTVAADIAVGSFPTAASFSILPGASVDDLNGIPIAGLSVVLSKVTIQ